MRRRVTITLPKGQLREVPAAMFALAEARTLHLARLAYDTPVSDIAVYAYFQGVEDTCRALDRSGE